MKNVLLVLTITLFVFSLPVFAEGYDLYGGNFPPPTVGYTPIVNTAPAPDSYYSNPAVCEDGATFGRYEEPNMANVYLGQSAAKLGGGLANLFQVVTLHDLRCDVMKSIGEDGPFGVITGPLKGVAHMGYRGVAAGVQTGTFVVPAFGPLRYPNGDAYDEYSLPVPNPAVSYQPYYNSDPPPLSSEMAPPPSHRPENEFLQ